MSWWHRLLNRRKMEEQLEKELRFHLDQHTRDLLAQGLPPEEARRQARLAVGGPEQVKEECRDARSTRWLDNLLQDIRYALRTLQRDDFRRSWNRRCSSLGGGSAIARFGRGSSVRRAMDYLRNDFNSCSRRTAGQFYSCAAG
jgi:hypothetical protein